MKMMMSCMGCGWGSCMNHNKVEQNHRASLCCVSVYVLWLLLRSSFSSAVLQLICIRGAHFTATTMSVIGSTMGGGCKTPSASAVLACCVSVPPWWRVTGQHASNLAQWKMFPRLGFDLLKENVQWHIHAKPELNMHFWAAVEQTRVNPYSARWIRTGVTDRTQMFYSVVFTEFLSVALWPLTCWVCLLMM